MGCSISQVARFRDERSNISAKIDHELDKEGKFFKSECKILLLGPGESGKSTLMQFTKAERAAYRDIVFTVLCEAFPLLSVPLPSHLQPTVNFLVSLDESMATYSPTISQLDPEITDCIKALWSDYSVKQILVEQGNKLQLNDSATYFFDQIDRIGKEGYEPTTKDILHSRVRTTGVVEECFTIGNDVRIRVVDVGGQRAERRKWIHCFEDVNLLLFVCAISEVSSPRPSFSPDAPVLINFEISQYDQKVSSLLPARRFGITLNSWLLCLPSSQLWEDRTVSRLDESFLLFRAISNSRWFQRSALILFMNKIDLLTLKLTSGHSPIKVYCPDYKGAEKSTEQVCEYFKHKFDNLVQNRNLENGSGSGNAHLAGGGGGGRLYASYFTTATEESVHKVVDNVLALVFRSAMREAGLL